MTTIEKIKAEIERRMNELAKDKSIDLHDTLCRTKELNLLLSFLDTLESEEPMNQDEDFRGEMREWVDLMVGASFPEQDGDFISEEDYRSVIKQTARHFAQWGAEHAKIDVTDFCKPIDPGIAQCIADHSWEMLGEDEKPVPNDLEEAAKKYATEWHENPDGSAWKPFFEVSAIKAFIAGAEWDRQHMLKEAVELGTVDLYWEADGDRAFPTFDPPVDDLLMPDIISQKFEDGQKVRIIIVKEDEK